MRSTLEAPAPDFGHLLHMTDQRGTFEHALFTQPRPEHGYCSDDMARVLIVVAREPDHIPEMRSRVPSAIESATLRSPSWQASSHCS